MGYAIRITVRFGLLLTMVLCLAAPRSLHATPPEGNILDEGGLTQLEARAQTSQPREQCFLYAELVHQLTEMAGRQLANGEGDHASITLRRIDTLVQKIHMSLARDTKKLKNAELLIHYTTRRLADMMHIASNDDRPVLEATLKSLNTIQNELLTQVFVH